MLGSVWSDRGTTDAFKASEKKSDPNGYSLGVEVTPVGVNVNDCCLLNYDEKAKWLEKNNDNQKAQSCSSIKFKGS